MQCEKWYYGYISHPAGATPSLCMHVRAPIQIKLASASVWLIAM